MNITGKQLWVKKLFVSLIRFIIKPITAQPILFLLIYILSNGLDIYSYATNDLNTFFKVCSGLFFTYVLMLPLNFLHSIPRRVYKIIVIIVAVIIFSIDFYLFLLYQNTFDTMGHEAIAAIMATNPAEAKEFVNTSFAVDKIILLVMIIALILTTFYYLNRIYIKWYVVSEFIILALIALSFNVTLGQFYRIEEGNIYYLLTKECPDLRDYRQNPDVVCSKDSPNNIVLVIGESFTKWHSSLYGYEKETNPLLGQLVEENRLHVYKNVRSYFPTTIPTIKSLMTSYVYETADSIKWYERLTLIEIMQRAGYRTYWISNQSKTGLYDNEVGRYADLCDEQAFVGNMHSGLKRNDLDECLLPLIDEKIKYSSSKNFYIIQMMGSHGVYNLRYPPEYAKFTAEDYAVSYSRLTPHCRGVLSHYDNSILYNDNVVYEIMKRFEQKDAIVIYLSDHGQDMYNESDEYCGHSQTYGLDIPMMFYPTPAFCDKFDGVVQSIKKNVDVAFRTDSLMYTVMDIAGIETVNGVSYKQKSLFNK